MHNHQELFDAPRWKKAAAFAVLAAAMALTIWGFAPVIWGGHTFAFRDAAHFYPPLWRLAIGEWAAGRTPLWNPYENLGHPLLAHPAAAVCYPGQLVFLLPVPFLWAYHLYIVGHVVLAAVAAYRLARSFRASAAAAGMCGLAYAFSGNVLMQHTNAPFLVGAAWLPWALLCTDRMARSAAGPGGALVPSRGASPESKGRKPVGRWSAGLAACLALMVLGGDPQMAYNVGLIAALYAAAVLLIHRRRYAQGAPKPRRAVSREARRYGRQTFCRFGGAALVAAVLAAVQLLPSWQFAARSDRVPPSWGDRLRARLEPRSHHEHVYHFSVGPWRLAEFLWPNASGRQYPIHRRWLEAIPAEGRVWTPTMYMGILPLALGLAALRFRRGPLRRRWLSWLALLSAVAAFGYYGFGWLLAEFGIDSGLGGPFGGLYWLMTLLLPGYIRFRYPAKLMVVTALALSVLAAGEWDRVFAGHGRRARRLLFHLGWLSGVGLLGAVAARPFWSGWMAAAPADPLFGPLDAAGAWRDLASGLAQTAAGCAAFGGLLWAGAKARTGKTGGLLAAAAPHAALLLLAADLGWSNAWMVATVPNAVAARQSRFGRHIVQATAEGRRAGEAAGPRVWRHPIWTPPAWRQSGSADRLAESMRFDRDTLWPNYNFAMRVPVVEVHGTMMLRDYADFLARRRTTEAERRATVFDLAAYAVRPPGRPMPGHWQRADRLPNAVLWRNRRPLPRAWIAGPDAADRPRNFEGESCRVVYFDPQRVEVEATLVKPGLVVLAEQFYPGWRLQVSAAGEPGRAAPIRRAAGVMRGADLPAGRHRLEFVFRPRIVYVGAAVSAAGWLALGGWVGLGFRTACGTST